MLRIIKYGVGHRAKLALTGAGTVGSAKTFRNDMPRPKEFRKNAEDCVRVAHEGGGRQRARGASTKFIGEESIRRSGARLARTGRTDGMDGPAEVHPPRRRE